MNRFRVIFEDNRKVMNIEHQVSTSAFDLTLCNGFTIARQVETEFIENLLLRGINLKQELDHAKSKGEGMVDIKINKAGKALTLSLNEDPNPTDCTKNRMFVIYVVNHLDNHGVTSPLLASMNINTLHKSLVATVPLVGAGFSLMPASFFPQEYRKPMTLIGAFILDYSANFNKVTKKKTAPATFIDFVRRNDIPMVINTIRNKCWAISFSFTSAEGKAFEEWSNTVTATATRGIKKRKEAVQNAINALALFGGDV